MSPRVSVFGGGRQRGLAFDGPGEDLSRLGQRVFRGDGVVLRLSPGRFAGVSLY